MSSFSAVKVSNFVSAVKDSMADIITGFTHAVADLQKKDIGARVHPDTLKALNEICTNFVVEVGKQLMAHRDRQLELQKEHEERIARMLERNKGVWMSDGWMKILIVWHLSLHPNGVVAVGLASSFFPKSPRKPVRFLFCGFSRVLFRALFTEPNIDDAENDE